MSEVIQKVHELVRDHLEASKSFEKFVGDEHLINDLGADSLDMIELVMLIEDEFDIEISEDAMEKIDTVGDLVNAAKLGVLNS